MQDFKISKRQHEIIDCAGKILSKAGISGLTTKNLALEMQFSESALYRHFKSKGKIIESMLEFMAYDIDVRLSKAINPNQTPIVQFEAMFSTQFDFFAKNPHFVVAAFSDGLMEESKEINVAIKKIMVIKFKHLMPILMAGQKQNFFTNQINAKQLVHIVMGTFRLMMFKWRLDNFKFDIKKEGTAQIKSLLKIITVK
jgi:AcrR family transcriptional regulator